MGKVLYKCLRHLSPPGQLYNIVLPTPIHCYSYMPLIICQQYGGHQEQKSLLQFIRLFLSMRVVWPRDGRGSFIHSNKLIFLVDPIQSLLKFGSCRGNSFVHWMYHISSGSDYHWHAYKQFMVAHTCKRSAAVYN